MVIRNHCYNEALLVDNWESIVNSGLLRTEASCLDLISRGVAGTPAEGVGAYLREQIAPQGALPPHKQKLLEMP